MPTFSDAQLKAALKSSAGIMTIAANKLGVTRQAVYARVRNSEAIQEFILDVESELIDSAEAVIADAILKKDKATTRWYLERKGRSRGYVTRQEMTGKDGAPLEVAPVAITVQYVTPPKVAEDEDVI